jgi:hypothetical protein
MSGMLKLALTNNNTIKPYSMKADLKTYNAVQTPSQMSAL